MKKIVLIILVLMTKTAIADCKVLNSSGREVRALNDALFLSLRKEESCPINIMEFKDMLSEDGPEVSLSMVANRGIHNPKLGSFSFFESVKGNSKKFKYEIKDGDFFFGHFTSLKRRILVLDQSSSTGKLMIELIVWDYKKQIYNFYELIGTRANPQWFYRGDSRDAYTDNKFLKRQKNSNDPQFGTKMRCSGCHNSGGPIMKELDSPHNDWWTKKRKLSFGNYQISETIKKSLSEIRGAHTFSKSIKKGMKKLASSPKFNQFKSGLNLQERLRPLFCTTEVNLISADKIKKKGYLSVSSSYWINPFFIKKEIRVNKNFYKNIVQKLGMRFPETNNNDADHAWLSPIKGYSNLIEVSALIKSQLINKEFALDVLAIDFKNPLFSKKRCRLLKLVPLKTIGWRKVFLRNLTSSELKDALKLKDHFLNKNKSKSYHRQRALNYLKEIQKKATLKGGVEDLIKDLHLKRASVFRDEISQNPRGQILEPGFRVIFPIIPDS